MKTVFAFIAALFTALLLFFAASVIESLFFKPHELGAILGTAFVYGRLILIFWVARAVYKKIKGRQVIIMNNPTPDRQTSTSPKSGSEELNNPSDR